MAKINVMVKVQGRAAQAVEFDEGATVATLKASQDLAKYSGKIDGDEASDTDELYDGAFLTFGENTKGA